MDFKNIESTVRGGLDELEKKLDDFEVMKNLQKKTGIKKAHIFLGLVFILLIFCSIIQNLIHVAFLATGLVPMVRRTVRAHLKKLGDHEIYSFWLLFATLSVIEHFLGEQPLLYHAIKMIFLLYLSLPQTNGIEFVTDKFITPLAKQLDREGSILDRASDAVNESLKKKD
eukprot:TRINITY_DN119_c1_g2_i1.p1 TRINITY_DN119_c1_g2~~TRINITY_DN119_c1_g2_i1.p1  ORF type:complete len:170 (-),score=76.99 TRINITY_DN119_c1_g2_i1:83-592(-)